MMICMRISLRKPCCVDSAQSATVEREATLNDACAAAIARMRDAGIVPIYFVISTIVSSAARSRRRRRPRAVAGLSAAGSPWLAHAGVVGVVAAVWATTVAFEPLVPDVGGMRRAALRCLPHLPRLRRHRAAAGDA